MLKELFYDKVMMVNLGALTLSFSNIENTLKIFLLITSIIYTIIRIVHHYHTRKCENDKSE